MREFWLSAVKQYSNDTYIVYQTQRLTYNQVHLRAAHTADVLVRKYGVQKGSLLLKYYRLLAWVYLIIVFRRQSGDLFPQLPRLSCSILGLSYVALTLFYAFLSYSTAFGYFKILLALSLSSQMRK